MAQNIYNIEKGITFKEVIIKLIPDLTIQEAKEIRDKLTDYIEGKLYPIFNEEELF